MNIYRQTIGFYTILRRGVTKTLRIWPQTLLPAAMTTILYFVIFGHVIGHRIGDMQGYPYIAFIAPGLIMMHVITSSYSATVSAVYFDRFSKCIEEVLVSPLYPSVMLLGYVVAGMMRGLLVSILITIIAMLFTDIGFHSLIVILLSVLLSSGIFAIAGVINGVYAKSWDDVAIIPTFVLTPLTYLGGVFFSVSLLPPMWRSVAYFNPILYLVNTFRYGFLELTDVHVVSSLLIMTSVFFGLFFWARHLFVSAKLS